MRPTMDPGVTTVIQEAIRFARRGYREPRTLPEWLPGNHLGDYAVDTSVCHDRGGHGGTNTSTAEQHPRWVSAQATWGEGGKPRVSLPHLVRVVESLRRPNGLSSMYSRLESQAPP